MDHLGTTVQGDLVASEKLASFGRIVSHAALFKEKHGGVTLKVGLYNAVLGIPNYKSPAYTNPRSVVRLSSYEIDVLIQLLSNYYEPVKMGARKFIKVDDEEVGEILTSLHDSLKGKGAVEALRLIDQYGLLPENVLGAVLHRDKTNAVAEFEEMLAQDLTEPKWQKWFERNDWVLGSSHVVVLDERDIDVNTIGDFIVEGEDHFADVIEIKRPGLAFWSKSLDHNKYLVPHSDLVKAITQANNYLFSLETISDSRSNTKRLQCPIARPRATLIHGRSRDWTEEHYQAQRLLNSSLSGIQVLTYDQVLARAKRAVEKPQPIQEPCPPGKDISNLDEYDPFAE